MKKNTLILLLSCLFINVITAQNLLVNGNFESGGVGVGFNINSTGYNYVATPTGTTSPGNYSFGSDPLPYNTSNFISGFDHTTGLATGKMMIIDGSTDGGNPSFWKAGNSGGGVCGLTVGATYTFRYWVKTISTNVVDASTQPDIRVVFNNATILTSPTSFLAPLPATGWEMRTYTFTPTNACVNIELRNFNTNPVGNDFAIDDLSLTPPASPLSITYSALNTSCPASSDGSIAIYAAGGTQPYTSYSITGPVTQTNALGIFTGLPAGTYTISVTDSAPTTISQSNVVIANPVNPLVVSSNTSICNGSNTTLSVSGGSTYTWTASPADPSLTSPNSATPTVSPSVTTTYTVTSSITSPRSLIVNGDFSQGNSGFGTDYQYLASAPVVGVQKAYGIVTNPSSWFTPFSNCPDHTTGTGNMMVVDGSNLNAGNDRLWSQTVPVLPGQNHTFSYWIQTVATPNPAQIEVLINGVSQGIGLAPAIATCGNWTQYSYVWNSGASNTAQIVMYDRNTNVAGNDFAIDDISFTTNATCSVSKSVTVTVNTLALIVPGNQIVCNGTLIPLLSFPTNLPGSTVSWTNDNPLLAIGSAGLGNLTNVLATNTTSAPIVATITVTASLSGCTDVTSSFTITINPSPSVLVNSPVKCTGDTAPVLIQATPSVAGAYNYAWTVPAGVPAPGNVPSFNSAIAGNYTVVITNATTGCISQPSTGTLTYITNCCPDEITIDAPNPVLCNASSCTTISASYIDIKDTTSYTVASIPYAPLVPLGNAGTSLCNVDDAYSAVTPIPFDFSFYGSCFDSFQLSTNTYLTFTTNNPNCTGGSPWAFTQAIPALFGANAEYQNSIYFPMNDTNPAVATPAATPIDVRYIVDGVAPCRKLIVNIKNMPLFSCGTAQGLQESQLVLYESTNIIDVYVKSRTVCAGWNSGSGVIGLTGQTAAEGIAAPGRNTGTWTATNEAWRFSPSGPSLTSFRWLENGNPIGTTPTISVCPSVTTTYTAEVRYTQCNVPGPPATIVRTVTEPVTIEVFPDDTLAPNSITNCIPNNIFNLTSNEPTVLGALNGTGAYDVYYYTNQADAENAAANSIANPAAYQLTSGTSQTIYMSLISTNNPCIRVKSFNIILDDCSTCPTITNPSPTQTLCLNSDPTPFTVNTTFTGANSISYVYFTTSQVGTNMYTGGTLLATVTPNAGGIATYDAPVLGSIGSLPNALGTYYVYVIANPAPSDVTCRPFQLIQVNVNTSPNAGTDGNTTICETSTTPINLFNLITGEQAGGTWSQTGGTGGVFNAAAGTYTPAIGATTSTFNYTLTGVAPCTGDFSVATVNINAQPNAGTDGSLDVCIGNTTTIDLFTIITGEQNGGTWVRTSGTGGTFNALAGTFTPSATTTNSTFTYTLLGITPCIDDSSIATINFVSQPTAGIDGSLNICGSSSTSINLFSLITGESSGGVWTQTSGSGGTFNAGAGTFTPSAGTTSSTFEYTVTGATPCGVDTSIASVNITAQLDAGLDDSLTVCETGTTIDLYSIITGEQSGGAWTRTGGTGGTFDSVNGTFTPAVGSTTSTFLYTLTGTAPCISDSSVATVNINAQPVAGVDGATTVCETSTAAITLATLITGEQIGGTWIRTGGTGGAFNAAAGTFTPALGATTSTFEYTLLGTAPCINDSSVATVNINAQPVAGVDGATTVCETLATAINLSTLITGEQSGGTWTRTSGTGGVFNAAGTFTPAAGATTSTFLYTLTGTAPCIDDTSIATVNINAQPVAGVDGATTVCETSIAAIDLFSLITGEQSGGTWTRTSGTGGTFSAAAGTFTPAVGSTTSTFLYTLTGTAPCINDSSVATVNINAQPIAGVDGATTVCETSTTAINLATLITGEQSGGTWTRTSGTGGAFNAAAGTFTPAVGATTSTFLYTLTGTAPCIDDTSTATVNINAQPVAGADGATTVCETLTTPIDLFTLITGEQSGGTWTRTGGTGGAFNAAAATFIPAVGATTSAFTYTLLGTAPCINDTSVATVNINPQPIAGNDGATTVCETSTTAINLATLITGEQIGGTWTRTSGTGGAFSAAAGTFTPAVGATTSTFLYTLTGTAPCIDDTSIATVNINAQPNAGSDGGTTICQSSTNVIDLFSLITGEQSGGTWTRTSGTGGTFNAAAATFTSAAGATTSTFAYTLTATAPCINDTSIATVNIITAPTITTPTPYQVCDENADGISCLFFLQTKNVEVTTNLGLVVTYHLTSSDALTGSNPITQNPYCNITPFSQLLHVRVVDPLAPACPSTTTLQLIVNPKPLINPNVTDYALCDNNSPGDGVEQFNLPTKTAQIINGQPNMTVRYYLTQADAENQVIPSLPNLHTNSASPNTQVIWYTIRNTVTGCISVGSFNLIVNPLPVTTVNSPTVCTGDAATVTATVSTAGTYSYVWTVPTGVPNPGNVASFTTTVAGTYSVVTTNTVTGCVGLSASGIVNLIYAPIITTPSNYVVCDENNDGESCLFDLTTKNSQISTQVGIQISYHLTPTDAQTGSNPISTTTPYCNITNPQTIHVRVFDPLAPACSSFTSFQLIVTPKPVANAVSDYNLCDSNPSLAITEAVFNLTGVVTPQVLGTTLPSASHTVTYYTSLADAQVPTNAISAIAAQAYTSPSTTLWIRVQNNTTGCFDITTVNLVVNPLPNILPFYPQYELCETIAPLGIETFNLNSQLTAILLGQTGVQVTFYPSLGQAQAGTGAIVNTGAYPNAIPYAQTLGIRITNTATGCYSISTMDLVVNPKPQPIAPTTPYTVCDDDQDGISQFDLNTLTSGILLGAPGVYDISYYLTQVDAQTPLNPISLTTLFTNNQAFVQFLWVRAEDPITGCFTVIQIELNVDPSPVMPTTLPIIANCDADSNTQDGCTTFNLTTQTPIILAAQALPASNYTVTYYTNQADASSTPNGTLPIFNTTNYTACGTTTIWVRVQNKNTGCFQVGSFQLQVNTPIVLTTPTLLSVCDNDNLPNDDHTTFNMLGFISPSVPAGHTIEFYTSTTYTAANLITNPSAFINTTPGSQTVFIVVTNTATTCKSYRTLTVQVLPVPTPNNNMTGFELEDCDDIGPNDGSEIFDLTTNAAYIANGDPNVTLHYYLNQADAIADQNEILTPTSANVSGNVWIRVESSVFTGTNGQNCYVLVEQPIIVNPVPIIVPGLSFQECDDDTDGFTLFNLNSNTRIAQLLAGNALPLSGYTLNFYFDSAATIPISSSYTNISNPQTIYVRATNIATGCPGPVEALIIFVNPKPELNEPSPYSTCDASGANDGYSTYDLTLLIPAILGATQTTADYDVFFYDTEYNPEATPALTPAPITDLVNYQAYTHTLWISVKNKVTGCEKIGSFNIYVEQPPTPVIVAPTDVICVDYNTQQVVRSLVLTANNTTVYLPGTTPLTYTYQWYDQAGVAIPGATSQTYEVADALPNTISSDFTVVMTSTSVQGCNDESAPFTVLQSGQAVAIGVGYEVSNAFSDMQTITVTVTGYGTYLYSLDGGPRQTSNVFENVPLGVHTITVWDDKGGVASSCDPFQLSGVQIIDYPHYFTPNGDGINDYWNIVGLEDYPSLQINIFDRFGKLIKQISPASKGWDGTYNGNLMPSTDYWFTVKYPEANVMKEFKAHFALKR